MSFLTDDKNLIDSAMSTELVSGSSEFDKIVEAMRYSALGGKRLRGILTLEFAKMFGCDAGRIAGGCFSDTLGRLSAEGSA